MRQISRAPSKEESLLSPDRIPPVTITTKHHVPLWRVSYLFKAIQEMS